LAGAHPPRSTGNAPAPDPPAASGGAAAGAAVGVELTLWAQLT
jgi:hypothetical protein